MRKNIFYFFCFLMLAACQKQELISGIDGEGAYSFKLEYAPVRDANTDELADTRSSSSPLPSHLSGYLFIEGSCTEILSASQLGYNPQTGAIKMQFEGKKEGTLYFFASNDMPDGLPGASIGMAESDFLSLKTERGTIGQVQNFYSAKVSLLPGVPSYNLSVNLERSYATISLLRSGVFQIERLEISSVSSSSYYYNHTPLDVPGDTVNHVYSPQDLNAGSLNIDLLNLYESKGVKLTVYGKIFDTKVSLDFDLPEVNRNNRYTLKLESPGIDPTGRKFMVVAICGESNAVGFDESPIDLNGTEAPSPHIYQLGLRTSKDRDYSNNLKILPMDFCPQDMYDMRVRHITKKLHLPLGKELLKRIPKGYEVLVIDVTRPSSCITYEGCRALLGGQFVTAAHNNGLGFYDREHMLPANLNAIYYWNKESAFNKMLTDRIKYALDLNTDNKLLGVVWCQGEDDQNPSWVQKHYSAFDTMTAAFFKELNDTGYGSRCPRGAAGKHIWYNYTTTNYWLTFHLTLISDWKVWGHGTGQSVFGGYKLWNPDTFVRPPSTPEYTNETNGTGITVPVRPSHYGNGAYHKIIAPMVAECMDRNGGLFNGKNPVTDAYTYKMTREEAQSRGGSITDNDVQDGLLLALPFDEVDNVTHNLARNSTGVTITNNGLAVSPSAFDLPAVNGGIRTGNTLKMTHELNKNIRINFTNTNANRGWSATCLVRRTARQGETQQMILGNGQTTATPYMAFRITGKQEKCGPYAEFLASPAMMNRRETSLPGSLHNANRVRSYEEWIHYGVTYDAETHLMRIFMNGEEVESYVFTHSSLRTPSLSVPLYLGTMDGSNRGMQGELSEFFFWNKPITDEVLYKVYLRSYWGYGKTFDVDIHPDTDWN